MKTLIAKMTFFHIFSLFRHDPIEKLLHPGGSQINYYSYSSYSLSGISLTKSAALSLAY